MTGRAGLKLSPVRICEWDMLLLLNPIGIGSWTVLIRAAVAAGAAKRPSVLPYAC